LIKVAVSLVFAKRGRFEGLVVLGGFISVGGNLLPDVPKQQGRGRTTFLWPEGSGFRCCPGLVPFLLVRNHLGVTEKRIGPAEDVGSLSTAERPFCQGMRGQGVV